MPVKADCIGYEGRSLRWYKKILTIDIECYITFHLPNQFEIVYMKLNIYLYVFKQYFNTESWRKVMKNQ
jgi:hypothetical protein